MCVVENRFQTSGKELVLTNSVGSGLTNQFSSKLH